MSDQRLRALERALLTTGTLEAEAAVLAERRRLGHLDEGALALAAYAGSLAAMRVLGEPALELSVVGLSTTSGLRRWKHMLRLAPRRDVLLCVEPAARTALSVAVAERRVTRAVARELEQALERVRDAIEQGGAAARAPLRALAARRARPWGWWSDREEGVASRSGQVRSWWREREWQDWTRELLASLARADVEREHATAAREAARVLLDARTLAGAQADVVDQIVRAELQRLALR